MRHKGRDWVFSRCSRLLAGTIVVQAKGQQLIRGKKSKRKKVIWSVRVRQPYKIYGETSAVVVCLAPNCRRKNRHQTEDTKTTRLPICKWIRNIRCRKFPFSCRKSLAQRQTIYNNQTRTKYDPRPLKVFLDIFGLSRMHFGRVELTIAQRMIQAILALRQKA